MTKLEIDGQEIQVRELSSRKVDELFNLYMSAEHEDSDAESDKKLKKYREEVIALLPEITLDDKYDNDFFGQIPASERRKILEHVTQNEVFAELDFMKPPEM